MDGYIGSHKLEGVGRKKERGEKDKRERWGRTEGEGQRRKQGICWLSSAFCCNEPIHIIIIVCVESI